MTDRYILKEVQNYAKARQQFCQSMANFALNPQQNLNCLNSVRVIDLLIPLLCDSLSQVRINSVCCLSRMANQSKTIATELVDRVIHQILLREVLHERNNNLHYKIAVAQALKAMVKHDVSLAEKVVECGGLSAFLILIEEQDASIKEAAVCGVGSIVRNSADLATLAISQGAITLITMCLQHHETSLKRVAAYALGDIALHGPVHAKALCDTSGTVMQLIKALKNIDAKLKKSALLALTNIVTHNVECAEFVVGEDIFPNALILLKNENLSVRGETAHLIEHIVKHSNELAEVVVNSGGIGAIIETLTQNISNLTDNIIVNAANALGHIAGMSPHFALAIIECKGVDALAAILRSNRLKNDNQLAACIGALGNIGKHTPEHCHPLAELNVFPKIVEIYTRFNINFNIELAEKVGTALKVALQTCLHVPALESLLGPGTPNEILFQVLSQLSKILPKDVTARTTFLENGGLKRIQQFKFSETDTTMNELVNLVTGCYPADVVKLCAPGMLDSPISPCDLYLLKNV